MRERIPFSPSIRGISRSTRVYANPPRLNCPLGYFHGLSILLDLEAAPKCASCLLDDVEVDLPLLFQRLLPGGAPFICA